MPLEISTSKDARSRNIKREIDAGKDPKQAAAIGYSVQRKAAKKKRKGRMGDAVRRDEKERKDNPKEEKAERY